MIIKDFMKKTYRMSDYRALVRLVSDIAHLPVVYRVHVCFLYS